MLSMIRELIKYLWHKLIWLPKGGPCEYCYWWHPTEGETLSKPVRGVCGRIGDNVTAPHLVAINRDALVCGWDEETDREVGGVLETGARFGCSEFKLDSDELIYRAYGFKGWLKAHMRG